MNTQQAKWYANARIVWAITAKDLVDGLKNKTTLAVLISVLFIIFFYRALPTLTLENDHPTILVYDAGQSSLVPLLENDSTVEVYASYSSEEKMKHFLANGDVPELGLVIPTDFDLIVAQGGSPELQGYVLNWVKSSEAARLQGLVEAKINELVGASVRIRVDIYHLEPDSHGIGLTATMAMLFAILMVGISFIPNLMFEEKRTKTIDALLVSPANPLLVTISKALTGLIYGLLCFGVSMVVYRDLIVHWWLVVLAALCGTLFAVALGLVLGTLLENRQQLMIWAWVVILPLFIPLILSLESELFPKWLIQISKWVPSVSVADVILVSFSDQSLLAFWAPRLVWVLAWAGMLLGLVTWLVKRAEK